MVDIVCIGNICVDVIGKYIDNLPERGKLEFIESMELHLGGCATNVSIALAKLGLTVAISGKIGDDSFGDIVYQTLKKEGVDIRGLKRMEGLRTSSSFVSIGRGGERTFLHTMASNAYFQDADVDTVLVTDAKVLLITGTFLMPKFDGEPAAGILKKARQSGAYTIMDTAWDPTGQWMKTIEPCLPHLDLFIPSEEEAAKLSGKTNSEEMADFFRGLGVKLVVIKLGKKGCFIKSSKESFHIPAFDRIEAVDTTGAGDSFVAGFIVGIANGWDLKRCGVFANAVGTHCVMSIGASSGIKSVEEIQRFVDTY